MLVATIAGLHFFRTCGFSHVPCKALYALGLVVLLYVICDTALECSTSQRSVRQRVRQCVIQFALLAIVLALFTHGALWRGKSKAVESREASSSPCTPCRRA